MKVLGIQRRVVVEGLQLIAEVRDAGRLVGRGRRQHFPESLIDARALRVDEQQADDILRVGLRQRDRQRSPPYECAPITKGPVTPAASSSARRSATWSAVVRDASAGGSLRPSPARS